MKDCIDFALFRKGLEDHFIDKQKDADKGGRPACDCVLIFKILILQRFYIISDDATEYALLDRLSFMRFSGLTLSDRVPDAKTIWNLKNTLAQGDMAEELFARLDRELNKRGVIAHKGKMVDASFVEVPRQRNTREENRQLREGETPQEWKNNLSKLRQKDTDATRTKHNGQNHFGYKDHVKSDVKIKLITGHEVTPAHVHDSNAPKKLLNKQDRHQYLYADSAYRSEEIQENLRKKKIRSGVHKKGYRDHPLSKKQKEKNRQKSKVFAGSLFLFVFQV